MALLLQQATEPNTPGRKIPLFRILTRVGSSSDCDIVIDHPDVCEDHATIIKEKNGFYLAVVGRGRPTYLNGKKIKKERLNPGDVIEIGDQTLVFYEQEPDIPNGVPSGAAGDSLAAFKKIVAFSQELLASQDIKSLMERLMENVVQLTKADRAFLILFQNGLPQVVLSRNIEQQSVVGAMSQLSDTIIARVVKDKTPLIVADALSDQEFKFAASVMNLRLNSVMCVPLLDNGDLLGLIYVGSNRAVNLFGDQELEILTVFGAQATLLIQNARQKKALVDDNQTLRNELAQNRFGNIIGSCQTMAAIYHTVEKVASTDISVLITGETGTGKELIAHELHRRSNRADKPFVAVNCGAIPENLLESELFGHVRGAFTGAVANRNGKFQQANGGTIFLDEIGDMPTAVQVSILRALQEHQIYKVGSNVVENIDIRVIAATNKDLLAAIKDGTFREDLYYRLNVVTLDLPALRDRGDDILLLARYFLKKYAAEYNSSVEDFGTDAVNAIRHYSWPGNIRQLENTIKRVVVMAESRQLSAADLQINFQEEAPVVPLTQASLEFQKRYVREILMRNGGNRTKTAKDLGVNPRTIYRYLELDGVDPTAEILE